MAIEKKDPGAGRPLRGLPAVPSPAPAARPRRPPGRRRPPARRPAGVPRPAGRLGARLVALFAAIPGAPLRTLLLWPTLLTLAVTLLRFAGELRGWSPEYFSRLPGGGLSPLGITWLAPLVGFYFGWRLERAGVRSPSPAIAFGVPAAALVVGPLVAALGGRLFKTSWTSNFALWAVVSVVVAAVAFAAGRPSAGSCWPTRTRPAFPSCS